jgi:hypothetical protein
MTKVNLSPGQVLNNVKNEKPHQLLLIKRSRSKIVCQESNLSVLERWIIS